MRIFANGAVRFLLMMIAVLAFYSALLVPRPWSSNNYSYFGLLAGIVGWWWLVYGPLKKLGYQAQRRHEQRGRGTDGTAPNGGEP